MIRHKDIGVMAQSAFWIMLLLFSIYYLGHKGQQYRQAISISFMYLPVVAFTAYFIVRKLIPDFLLKDHLTYFILYLVYTFIGSVYASLMIIISSLVVMANFQFDKLLTPLQSVYSFIGIIHFFIILYVAINVTQQWYAMQQKYLLALQEKSQAELKFLKTQLHPHFLFNTLNNLYYLTLQKSDKAPEVVMQLSQLLDYVLSQGKEMWVSLREECERMCDFAYLESLRYEDRLQLDIQTGHDLELYKFPPLLLVTLLENSFKHGVHKARGKATIQVNVQTTEKHVHVMIRNSKARSGRTGKTSGIGLPNIRKQLDFLYQNKYQLLLEDLTDSYTVNLTVPADAYRQVPDCGR